MSFLVVKRLMLSHHLLMIASHVMHGCGGGHVRSSKVLPHSLVVVVGVVVVFSLFWIEQWSDFAAASVSSTTTTNTTTTEFRRCRSPVTAWPAVNNTTNVTSTTTNNSNDTLLPPPSRQHQQQRSTNRRPFSSALNELYHSTCENSPVPMPVSSSSLSTESNESRVTLNSLLSNTTRVVVVVVVFVTHSATLQKSLALAAGLLTSGSRVTIVTTSTEQKSTIATSTSSSSNQNQVRIRRALFQHIPHAKHATASARLTFHHVVTMEASSSSSSSSSRCGCAAATLHCYNEEKDVNDRKNDPTQSAGDILLCSIQHALETVQALERDLTFSSSTGVVFIMDASFVAGLLLAERHCIPTIAVVEHATAYLRPLLGAAPTLAVVPPGHTTVSTTTTTTTTTTWSILQWSLSWWRIAWIGWHDRLDSLDLTSSFVALNRVRVALQLRRIRRMSDLWQASGTVSGMISSDPQATMWQSALPMIPIWIDPLVPPCIPCLHDDTATTTTTTTWRTAATTRVSSDGHDAAPVATAFPVVLVVAMDDDSSLRHTKRRFRSRRLMQALELTRTSIRDLAALESCSDTDGSSDSISRDFFCWKPLVDFHVVGPTSWMPEHWVPPDFVHAEDTNLLDSLARHQPVAIVASCDTTHHRAWTASTLALGGPPVLCVEASWSPREIAVRLLDLWRLDSANRIMHHDHDDGLELVVSMIERVGLLHDRNHTSWTNGQEMNRQLTRDWQWQRNTTHSDSEETFLFLESVFLPVAWIICGATTVFLVCQDSSAVHKLRLRRSHKNSLAPILCAISDELNLVLSVWSDWCHEHLGQWDDVDEKVNESRGREAMEQPGHSKRKRHPTKKRH